MSRPVPVDVPAISDERLREALSSSNDRIFDAHYGGRAFLLSDRYWTPLNVASRIAGTLSKRGVTRVLDVGAGPGKFCLAGASRVAGMHFVGVEQRADLVRLAKEAAHRLEISNASFVEGSAFDVDWRDFDALYFYNPFGENLCAGGRTFDSAVELSTARYDREIARTEEALAQVKVGTVVVTYHGIGGAIPATFELVEDEPFGISFLRVWLKERANNPRSECWRELSWGGVRRGTLSRR